MKALPTLCLLVLALAPLRAETAADLFREGNEALRAGAYGVAASRYRSLLEMEGPSAAAYYNLGWALYHLRDWGGCRLAWERAAWLDPYHPDIRLNLSLLASEAGLETTAPFWMDSFTPVGSVNLWVWTAGSAWMVFALVWAGLAAWRWRHPDRPMPWKRGLAVLICLGAIAVPATVVTVLRLSDRDRVVVTAADARLLLSPFATAEPIGGVPAGAAGRVTDQKDAFQKILLEDGRSGWIDSTQVVRVVP
jgi:hypothetical protein